MFFLVYLNVNAAIQTIEIQIGISCRGGFKPKVYDF